MNSPTLPPFSMVIGRLPVHAEKTAITASGSSTGLDGLSVSGFSHEAINARHAKGKIYFRIMIVLFLLVFIKIHYDWLNVITAAKMPYTHFTNP